MPGHQVRRPHQISVAIFVAESGESGVDLITVQYAALATTAARPGLDQATLAGFIAYDRTTIGGVVDRLVQKGHLVGKVNGRDQRARELRPTAATSGRSRAPLSSKARRPDGRTARVRDGERCVRRREPGPTRTRSDFRWARHRSAGRCRARRPARARSNSRSLHRPAVRSRSSGSARRYRTAGSCRRGPDGPRR